MFTMPFGKHKLMPIDWVPSSCLHWFLDYVEPTKWPTLRAEIRHVLGLDARAGGATNGTAHGTNGTTRPNGAAADAIGRSDLEAKLKVRFRELALEYHSDRRRRNHETMVALNDAMDRLRKTFKL